MGWCSATEIMDTALTAAYALAIQVGEWAVDVDENRRDPDSDPGPEMQALMAPFVAKLSEYLHDQDWDCAQDSEFFDQYPQEMLGYNDKQYEEWLAEQLSGADRIEQRKELVRKLSALHEKMEKQNAG